MEAHPHIVISVDPGITTGVAVTSVCENSPVGFDVRALHHWHYSERFAFGNWLYEQLASHDFLALVVEDFRLYANKVQTQIGSAFETVRLIGQIERIAYETGRLEQMHFQMAIEIDRVKVPSEHQVEPLIRSSDHCSDAYKHARRWMLTNQLIPWLPANKHIASDV